MTRYLVMAVVDTELQKGTVEDETRLALALNFEHTGKVHVVTAVDSFPPDVADDLVHVLKTHGEITIKPN
jgi:hypothetical protein